MSLLKTALACLLLAMLAPDAGAQTFRPATSQSYNQVSGFGRSSRAMPVRAQSPAVAEPDYDSTESDSGGAVWTSDSASSDYQESESFESVTPEPDALTYDPPSATTWDPSLATSGGDCSGGYCTDGSPSGASSWMGAYRFGGGNAGFTGPWYINADAFLLHRTNGNANIPITVNSNTGTTLLQAQNLTFTPRIGPRLMVGYAWSHTTAFEVSYFGLIDSRTQTTINGSSNLTMPGDLSLVATDFFNASQVNVSYSSRLNNAEFNVLRNTGSNPISWLYGFRYLGLNEHFDINSMGAVGTGNYAIMTRNNMFGIQGGLRWMFNYKRFALETTLKGGVLENATQQTQNVTDPAFPFPLRNTLEKGANVSFLSEVTLNASYRLTEHWALRTGYTLIWVDGLALAPNQIDTTFVATSGTGLNHGGNLLLTAVNLGVEFHW